MCWVKVLQLCVRLCSAFSVALRLIVQEGQLSRGGPGATYETDIYGTE